MEVGVVFDWGRALFVLWDSGFLTGNWQLATGNFFMEGHTRRVGLLRFHRFLRDA